MRRLCTAILVYFTIMASAYAQGGNCDIRDFLVKDVTSITQSGETELAFVLTSTRSEFENAQKSGAAGGAYGLISGSASWSEAKERAEQIAQATSFDYRSSYATSYFAQNVSAQTMSAYEACLLRSRETPGLTLWLRERRGDFFVFGAFWVGSDVTIPTAAEESALVDGGRIVAKPSAWIKGKSEEIVVRRESNDDMFLSLRVGGQTASQVIVKDPPPVVWRQVRVSSDKAMAVSTTPVNPGCQPGSASVTLYPTMPGGAFVKGTAAISNKTTIDPSRYTERINFSPLIVTATITQSTAACEHVQRASGTLMVLEQYPTAATTQ